MTREEVARPFPWRPVAVVAAVVVIVALLIWQPWSDDDTDVASPAESAVGTTDGSIVEQSVSPTSVTAGSVVATSVSETSTTAVVTTSLDTTGSSTTAAAAAVDSTATATTVVVATTAAAPETTAAVPFQPGSDDTVVVIPESTVAPVAIEEPADLGTGVTMRVLHIEHVEGVATRPGEVGGPSLRFTIEATNNTASAVALDSTVVDLAYGADSTVAVMLSGPDAVPLPDVVQPGQVVTGTYVFSVPVAERSSIELTVRYSAEAPSVVFEGTGDEF